MTHAPEIGFLFLGGEHQMLHLAPVAAELEKRDSAGIRIFASEGQAPALRSLFNRLGSSLRIETLAAPRWSAILSKLTRSRSARKTFRLIAARQKLAALTILVVAERTSTILQRFPGTKAKLVHIPHGAGDRAKGFERRLSLFDHIIVAGNKDRDRMIAEGVVQPQNCSVSGYIKVAAVRSRLRRAQLPRLFENERPIVLYNPHFSPDLSSWQKFAASLIAAFDREDQYNLIIAPHVRMVESLTVGQQQIIRALGCDSRIIVDLGSDRSCDMTYTDAADIYVGDVSSQVYEFISRPRPCVFLDAATRAWVNDPSFSCWNFGEVVSDPALAYAAIVRATDRFSEYRQFQLETSIAALGNPELDAVSQAADILISLASRQGDQAAICAFGRS